MSLSAFSPSTPSELGANLKISIVLAKKVYSQGSKRISPDVVADGLWRSLTYGFHSGFRREELQD